MEKPTENGLSFGEGQVSRLLADADTILRWFGVNALETITINGDVSSVLPLIRLYCLREALVQRMVNLAAPALDLWKDKRYLSALVLTRSVHETAAQIVYLRLLTDVFLSDKNPGELEAKINQLEMANRDPAIIAGEPALNILTVIKKVEKKYKGFEGMYNQLSEFGHPNFLGTSALFRKLEPPVIHFGPFGIDLLMVGGGMSAFVMALRAALEEYVSLNDSRQTLFTMLEEIRHPKQAPNT